MRLAGCIIEPWPYRCLPNICTCADGSERKTLTRLRPLLDLKDMCDGELPESCLCAGGEERKVLKHKDSINLHGNS